MELLLKVFALCVITAAVASLLRRNEGELALLLALCAAACAAALLIAAGEPLAALLRTLADKTGLSGAVFTPLWKVLAIALTVRPTSSSLMPEGISSPCSRYISPGTS